MRIRITKSLEIEDILKNIKLLNRQRKYSEKEKNKLSEYKKVCKAYEESGEVFYAEDFVTELTLKKFRKIFTTKRLDVLNQLNKNNFSSIAELSRFLKRDIKNVHTDLKILENFGLIKMTKQSKNIRPRLNVESVSIEFLNY